MCRYKGSVPSPQFRTCLKGCTSFGAPSWISLGLCCNYITVQLSCPILLLIQVLFLKDSPINFLHTGIWLKVNFPEPALTNESLLTYSKIGLNPKEEKFIKNHPLSNQCHIFVHDPFLWSHLMGTLLLIATYIYWRRDQNEIYRKVKLNKGDNSVE